MAGDRIVLPTDSGGFVREEREFAVRFGGRTIAAIVLFILATVILTIATTLSWWNLSASTGRSDAFYLGSVCSSGACQSYQGYPGLQDAFGLTNDLVLASLALSVVALVVFVLAVFWPRLGSATLATGLIGAVLGLAGPVYLYVALPGALATFAGFSTFVGSFFGSYTSPGGLFTGSVTYTWGGGSGWYVALVGFALLLVSTVFAFSVSRNLRYLGSFRQPQPGTVGVGTGDSTAAIHGQTREVRTARETFCPGCGSRYPAGTQFCSKDATPLKEVAE